MTEEATRKETIELLFGEEPTNPNTLEWKPILGILKGTIRLRMNITKQNVSMPLVDICRTFIYPDKDPPEVQGLIKVFEIACSRANLNYKITKGTQKLQSGPVGFFEPYKIKLPFKKAQLLLRIAPGEFQWILKNVKKEKTPLTNQLEILKKELLNETKEWLKRGNR